MVRLLALAALVSLATGCLVTGTLDPSGGARLTLNVRLVSVAHFDTIKTGLQSPDVTLRSASMTPRKVATFEVECTDVRKLPTAPSLSRSTVALDAGDAGARTLAVTIANPVTEPWSPTAQAYFGRELRISIELPGDVLASNATSTAGRTVSWIWPLAELSAKPHLDLNTRFRIPPSADVPQLHRRG